MKVIQNSSFNIQNYFVGGSSVFKARSLYNLYNSGIMYNDHKLCNAVGLNKNSNGNNGGVYEDEDALLNEPSTITNKTENVFVDPIFKLYPIPSNDIVHIEYSIIAETELDIYDVQGRKVKTILLNPNNHIAKIDITNLSCGVYTYKIIYNNSILNGKIIKE